MSGCSGRTLMRDAVSVIDESKIATHDEPAARERTNHIVRLDLADGMPGHYEQMWTRTEDKQKFELCCIPFSPTACPSPPDLPGRFTLRDRAWSQD